MARRSVRPADAPPPCKGVQVTLWLGFGVDGPPITLEKKEKQHG